MRYSAGILAIVLAATAGAQSTAFRVEEATIAQIHTALRNRSITCRALVDHYLRRIDAYDKRGPALNSIVVINPRARATADSLDARQRQGGFIGAMHCVPVIVKDNYDTYDLPTTAGSLSLAGAQPAADAPVVKRLRDAGAVVIAKSNMAEFAFSPVETVGSMLPGYTRNPYALDRVTAGSSGGTAAAVAASFGAVGLGTDTGNSIRGPSAHQALVGIRPTMGLISRAGVIPLNLWQDVTGPMTRTVADAAAVLQVIAGPDPADSATRWSEGKVAASYASFLDAKGLQGVRLGVLPAAYLTATTDTQVVAVFRRALDELRRLGATIVDSVAIDSLAAIRSSSRGGCSPFKAELNQYLTSHGERVPLKSLEEIIRSRRFHPSIEVRLTNSQASTSSPDTSAACLARGAYRQRLAAAVTRTMDSLRLDALVYPTWSNAPRLIGDLNTPAGDNNQFFSPTTGLPAITVPMGYLRDNVLPAGLQFFGRAWDEGRLIRLAYAYEQGTKHRRPPATTPPLPRR
jgi:Asp-tRNA(Asn)/Glu-tRNA(Gln) amidotransferase A subunit family amidase